MLSRELERNLGHAAEYAKQKRHEFVSLEHVLLSLTDSAPTVEILQACGGDIPALKKKLTHYIQKNCPQITKEQISSFGGFDSWMPEFTLACHRVLQRAAMQVQSAGRSEVNESHILVSLFTEQNSFAAFTLAEQGISQFDIINQISHSDDGERASTVADPAVTESDKNKSALESYCTNLNEKASRGLFTPLIGRDDSLERVIQILARRQKNNPLLIGEPGVGKTAIAEGLAQKINNKEVPESLYDHTIYSLDIGALLAGTKFRGDFEGRLKNIIKELKAKPKSILFIDEIHTIVGAGSTQGGSMDASNLLKPALADGSISCIGSTTHNEYRQHFEKDRALSRRFQKVDLREPTIEETIAILQGLKKHFEKHHNVQYSDKALRAAAELSAKHLTGRQLPDKAIDVIDEAGAYSRVFGKQEKDKPKNIRAQDIELIVAKMAQVPAQNVSASDKEQIRDLDKKLKNLIFGQDEAIEKLVSSIKLSRSGLAREDKPIGSYLFAGPTGVGKTEVCKQLAHILGVPFARFDMSEYMEKHSVARLVGAPPGYVGYEEGGLLTEQITKTPYCVLLLDEIEKAHPDLMNILLQVMDAGRLTDANGRQADFRNVILIMTTNAGAMDVAKGAIGITESSTQVNASESIKKAFAPEFINRLDATVHFKNLDAKIINQVAGKLISELSAQLKKKKIQIQVSEESQKWLAEKGYDKVYGARPMARVIDEHLKKPLVDEILFGKLQKGGRVSVELEDQQLKFTFN